MTTGVGDAERHAPTTGPIASPTVVAPGAEVLRDITRGGLSGLVVGILLAGVGGRVVMRLAALLVPDAAGSFTENGNIVGEITVAGTVALVGFIGLFFGAMAGSVWVVIRPWLPDRSATRAVLAVPIALAVGVTGLIEARNPDFAVLEHHPLVVASLVLLVALFGPALVVAERWFDRRLPHPGRGDLVVLVGYALVAGLGSLLTLALVVPQLLGSDIAVAGLALVLVGICTLAWWSLRIRGRTPAPPLLVLVARAGVAVATVAGLAVGWREVVGALGGA